MAELLLVSFIASLIVSCVETAYSIDVGGNIRLPYREILQLMKVAPDKWSQDPWSDGMIYDLGGGRGERKVFARTWIGKVLLNYVVDKQKANPLRAEWITDIERYQKQQREEAEQEIDQQSQDLKAVLEELKSLRAKLDSLESKKKVVYQPMTGGCGGSGG